MIQIQALKAFSDNYIWLLQDAATNTCAVVDPGDAAPVIAWLQAHPQWRLSDILITHHHNDHVGGVAQLKQLTSATVHGPATETIPARDHALHDQDRVRVLGLEFIVLSVPGHTSGHIAYYHEGAAPCLFPGDTLFAAGCGRLFEGTPAQMHASLQRFAALPAATQVYSAHEYTLSNLRFAQAVEPGNQQVRERLAHVVKQREDNQISLPTSIGLELQTNPFLRASQPAVIQIADERAGSSHHSAQAVFATLRAWKDTF